ncbi:hypothetical protein SCP_1201370 [Sparassis crispa]|uniref:Pali-domain-containing protein n=1 Tax=Sparassis crispa TaxID=139825 RepID=A0A401H0J3_9APHY|nr:hypothetical protein SCP_1201370 [Sparassis crispa]GBE87912.1 hypothetical protein SCP_1201370 [Sparassis crispa]
MFLALFAATVLQILVTFSTPFIRVIYFLETLAFGGVRFGLWGYCYLSDNVCSPKSLGYTLKPEFSEAVLMQTLILIPISAGISILALLCLFPLLCFPRLRYYPHPIFFLLTLLACLTSLAAFIVMLVVFATVLSRLHAVGYTASFGPAIWMELSAAIVLVLVAFNAGCGTCLGGRFGRNPSYLPYNY